MPNTKSAKKALRVAEKNQVFNKVRKSKIKNSLKEFRKSLTESLETAQEALSKVFSNLDKAAKGKTIKKQNASRKKSRLTKQLKKTFDQVPSKDVESMTKTTPKATKKSSPKKTSPKE